ncbi:MAG: ABC transporter ATP-binding protein [Kiritimatiellia bacterium]|jgi:subfamily B ATP-binding cassette protein MsbA
MASKQQKSRLKKDDLRTFMRLLGFARPYVWRLAIGALCSLVGGGSIIAMFLSGYQILGFVMRNPDFGEPPAAEAGAVAGEEAAASAAAAEPAPGVDAGRIPECPPSAAGGLPVPGACPATALAGAASAEPLDGVSGALARRFLPQDDLDRLERMGIGELLAMCGVMLVVIILNSLAVFASVYYLQWVGQRIVMDLRVKLFAHLQQLSLGFYNTSSSGDMISRAVADTQLLQHTVTSVVTDMIRQPVMLVMVLGYIVVTEWRLALFSLVLFPTVVVPIVLIGRRLRNISREGQRQLALLTSVMKESLDGVAVVKAFGQEAREEARFASQCRRFFRQMVNATKAKAFNDPITHIVGGLAGIGVLIYAMVAKMPIANCVIFACAIWALYEPVKKLGRIAMEIQQSSAAADRVFEILDTPITVGDAPDAVPVVDPLESLEFRNVVFSYGEREVFNRLNLTIRAGESLAVVGPSGGGKTTIVSLLLRFFDPNAGALLRNGVDVRSFTIASLRQTIGLVMQETFLFNATIAENIAYGCPDASRESIEHAARQAHAHEFILEKPEGYDTVVGERGVSLSGGQRQRIAIARALLRNPSVLILDEATSALDTESERMVQAAIDELMGRMTVIVIAHRLSTIAKCDRIAVIADGGVAECGTHDDLLARDGIFCRLHRLQQGLEPSAANGSA